jgi:hypothetical protein
LNKKDKKKAFYRETLLPGAFQIFATLPGIYAGQSFRSQVLPAKS